VLDASARGTARDRRASIPLYGVGPSVGAEWLLSERAFLGLNVAARFYLKRPELVVEDLPEHRRVQLASANVALGAGVLW
jgi:hypothetical protein